MARSKKTVKVKKLTVKKTKRVIRKSKGEVLSVSKILAQVNALMNKLSQDLQKQAAPFQKQLQKLEPKFNKVKEQQEKASARLVAAEGKIAIKGNTPVAKKQLNRLKVSADKTAKKKAVLEKELTAAQSELKMTKEGSSKLMALKKLIQQFEQDCKQGSQKKTQEERTVQKPQNNESITSRAFPPEVNKSIW